MQRASSRAAGILHGQRGEGLEPVGTFRHLFGKIVVGAPGQFIGRLRIGDRLDRRGIEREDHRLDPARIHFAQALLVNVEQPGR